jgi:molecular chaperone GrpE (heat shock protein)
MEPNQTQQTGEADEIRREMQQQQDKARSDQAQKMDELLNNVADNMEDEERDLRDDGRRHREMKTSLKSLQQQLIDLLGQN